MKKKLTYFLITFALALLLCGILTACDSLGSPVDENIQEHPDRVYTFYATQGGSIQGGDLVQTFPYVDDSYHSFKYSLPEGMFAIPDEGYYFEGWYSDLDGLYSEEKVICNRLLLEFDAHSSLYEYRDEYFDIRIKAVFKKNTNYTGDSAHLNLTIGEKCPICGLELYAKSKNDLLMFDEAQDFLAAESYGEEAVLADKSYAKKVKYLYLSPEVKKIVRSGFEYAVNLLSVTIPTDSHLEEIDDYAFLGCESLVEFIIPNECRNLRTVGSGAFLRCYSLVYPSLPDSILYVGVNPFDNTAWWELKEEGVVYYNTILVEYKGTIPEGSSIEVREGTKTIANSAFSIHGAAGEKRDEKSKLYPQNLRIVRFPQSLLRIGDRAFYGCSRLASATLPSKLLSVGNYAFADCATLTELFFPDSVTEIGICSVGYCSRLEKIGIGSGITEWPREHLHYQEFASVTDGCVSLKGIYTSSLWNWCNFYFGDMYSNPLSIAHKLYVNGELIKDLVIPNGVETLNDYAFYGCESIHCLSGRRTI